MLPLRLVFLSVVLTCVACSPIAGQNNPQAPSDGSETVVELFGREALNLGTEPDVSSDTSGCTTTLSETYGYPCTWDGTETIYPSTTIMFRQVDCHGCDVLEVIKDLYLCPNQIINATAQVNTPSTFWSTTCLPSAPSKRAEGRAPANTTPIALTAAPNKVARATAFPQPGVKGPRGPEGHNQPAVTSFASQ